MEIRPCAERFHDRAEYREFSHRPASEQAEPDRERTLSANFVRFVPGLGGRHPRFHPRSADVSAEAAAAEREIARATTAG